MLQVLVPQKLFIMRSKFSFFPSDAVSLAGSTPVLDAAGRMVLFKVCVLLALGGCRLALTWLQPGRCL